MKIVLGSDGSIELTRGEHITRGQDNSRQVFVEWAEGVSPIDTGQFLADNMVVEMCITRPDGEQSGWLTAVKVDGEIKYLYILQAWDTAVSGQASLQVRWYDITQEEENRIIEVSNEAFFIVDNGKIAQPLNLSSENYNDIVLRFIIPLSAQAFRKYDTTRLPDTITYSADGAKTAPALFYNFTHEVIDLVDEELNEQRTVREGFLFVGKCGEVQTEVFFSSIGKIYTRSFTESPAGDFKEKVEERLLNILNNYYQELNDTKQDKEDENLETESKDVVGAINEVNSKTVVLESKQIKNTNKIKAVENALISVGTISKANGTITKEVQQIGGTELDGLTILDNSYTTVNKIQGDTVSGEGFTGLKNAKISGIKSIGRNLFSYPYITTFPRTENGITFVENNGVIVANGTATKSMYIQLASDIKLEAGKKYSFSGNPVGWGTETYYIYVAIRKKEGGSMYVNSANSPFECPEYSNANSFLFIAEGQTLNNVVFSPMINIGETALLFETRVENVMSLPEEIELGKWDYVQDGQLVRQTRTITLKGSETWRLTSLGFSATCIYANPATSVSNYVNAVSNAYTFSGNITDDNTKIFANRTDIFIRDTAYSTVEDWKAHLAELYASGNPVIVAYELATPTVEPFEFDNNYIVWDKGLETILGNSNAVFGANPTIKNEYITLLGGNK